jgi:hypothetical protein
VKKRTPYLDSATGLWRIDDVPMVSTGIEYPASTGKITFTEDDLSDAVAATADVAISSPRVKLGHSSNYNEPLIKDAEPAFGRWENLRLGDKGQTIYGDMTGLPEWLAQVVNVAYPNRSVETWNDVETVSGHSYKSVITECSLLGVKWPGCSVLEDLPLWYGASTPAEAEVNSEEAVAASNGGGMRFLRTKKGEKQLAVDVSLIRRKFYNDGPGAENWDWWVRGERFDSEDGYTLIVDMGDGELARIPVTVDGNEAEFGNPVIVTEEYPDKKVAASAILAGMAISDPDLVIYASRADTDDRPNRREGGEQMDEATRSKLAKKLGLAENATPEQVNAKLAANALASSEGGGNGEEEAAPGTKSPTEGSPEAQEAEEQGNGENGGEQPATQPATPESGTTPTPTQAANGTVTLDREMYEQLKRGSDTALRLAGEQTNDRIKLALDDSIGKGKIPPARRAHYETLLKADFAGTKAMLDSLEGGAIPVGERGNNGLSEEGNQTGDEGGFPDTWFPEVKTIRANASRDRAVVNAKEG